MIRKSLRDAAAPARASAKLAFEGFRNHWPERAEKYGGPLCLLLVLLTSPSQIVIISRCYPTKAGDIPLHIFLFLSILKLFEVIRIAPEERIKSKKAQLSPICKTEAGINSSSC
jgi:hypothetical protein